MGKLGLSAPSSASSPVALTYVTPEDFGAVGDSRTLTDVACTNTSDTITSASAAFTPADVGKLVALYPRVCGTGVLTTIAEVLSATSVRLAAPANFTKAVGAATYGATGAVMEYATNDAAALQAFCNAVTAGAQGRIPKKAYGCNARLTLSGNHSIIGEGIGGKFGNFAAGNGLGVPWVPPFIDGSQIVFFTTGLASAIDVPTEGASSHLADWGIRFARPFITTGHGVTSLPGAGKSGLSNPRWDNFWVFGHDGNSYAWQLENVFQHTFTGLRYYGGGSFDFIQNHGTWAFGNGHASMCTGKFFVRGTAHGIRVRSLLGGAMSSLNFDYFGANAVLPDKYGFNDVLPLQASQKLYDIPSTAVNGFYLTGDNDIASTAVALGTLPSVGGTNGGVFISPSIYWNSLNGSTLRGWVPPTLSGQAGGTLPLHLKYASTRTSGFTVSNFYTDELVDATSGAVAVTLPALATAISGMTITIQKIDASANAVTISRASTNTIEGATSVVLAAQWDKVTLFAGPSGTWFRR